jgi:hypothetical protein
MERAQIGHAELIALGIDMIEDVVQAAAAQHLLAAETSDPLARAVPEDDPPLSVGHIDGIVDVYQNAAEVIRIAEEGITEDIHPFFICHYVLNNSPDTFYLQRMSRAVF